MICENHEGQPSILHEAVEKIVKKRKKTAHLSRGAGYASQKVRCLYFWRRYATVGTTKCIPNRPV